MKKWYVYVGFFVLLFAGYYLYVFSQEGFNRSPLPVINTAIQPFRFVDQDGKPITEKNTDGKVFVAEYFFTTCKGICPKMNANMRRVYDVYSTNPEFMILSHTCMPEVDSVAILKKHEQKMIGGKLVKNADGSYKIEQPDSSLVIHQPGNWLFLTGDKKELYMMARQSYLIDNNKTSVETNIDDQFIHTQFFSLVDKQGRVRGIYDGLKENEVQKLITDIDGLLKEKNQSRSL